MQEPTYNKEANDAIHRHIFESLGRIEAQTTATNGRVRWNEKMIYLAMGGLSVLSYFFAQDRLLLAREPEPVTEEEIAKALIELKAEAEKLKLDVNTVAEKEGVQ